MFHVRTHGFRDERDTRARELRFIAYVTKNVVHGNNHFKASVMSFSNVSTLLGRFLLAEARAACLSTC